MAFNVHDRWKILGMDCCCTTEDELEMDVTAISVFDHCPVDWKALRSHRWQTRRDAVEKIGILEADKDAGVSHDALAALRSALKDDHWQVRRDSVYALQRLGIRAVHESLPALWQACADQDACVRTAARSVLQIFGQDAPSCTSSDLRIYRSQMLHEKQSRLEAVQETTFEREAFTEQSSPSRKGLEQTATVEARIDTDNTDARSTTAGSGIRTDAEEVFTCRREPSAAWDAPLPMEKPELSSSNGPSALLTSNIERLPPSELTERAVGDDESAPDSESSVYVASI